MAALVSAACTNAVAPPAVQTVVVLPGADSVEVGSSISTFSAAAIDANGQEVTGRKVTWRITDPDIASVDANGKVTGLKIGSTRLVATIGGRPSSPIPVSVISKATRLLVVPDSIDVNLNGQKGLNAGVFDAAGSPIPGRVVTWSSANPLVAAVAPGGAVSAISLGETTVTATVGELHTVVKVRVVPEKVNSVRILTPVSSPYILRLGQSVTITATALNGQNLPLDGRIYSWNTSNPAIATVSQSTTGSVVVTGILLGTATITVDCEGLRDQIQIQVTQVPVATVQILPTDPTYLVGQNAQLAAVVKDTAGNALSLLGRNVIWTNSNGTVASVNNNGVINTISAGTTTVQLIVDQVASAPITVTVNQLPVVSVSVSPQTANIKVGLSQQLQATPRDINGNALNSRPVTWVSSNPLIATVTANGLVQAIAVGQVTITATSEGVPGNAIMTIIP